MVPVAGLPAATRTSGLFGCRGQRSYAASARRQVSCGPAPTVHFNGASGDVQRSACRFPWTIGEPQRTSAPAMPSNSTMRVRSRSRCSSRAWRPWAIRSSSAPSMARCRFAATSPRRSPTRPSCGSTLARVKRSNSRGRNLRQSPWPAPCAIASATRPVLRCHATADAGDQVAGQVIERAAELSKPYIQTRAADHHLTRLVDQTIEQLRTHTHRLVGRNTQRSQLRRSRQTHSWYGWGST